MEYGGKAWATRPDSIWNHYQPFTWWLLPHGLAGACALLLSLALFLFTGLYLFMLPYAAKWRSGRRS